MPPKNMLIQSWEVNSNTTTIPEILFTTIHKSTETFAHIFFTFT